MTYRGARDLLRRLASQQSRSGLVNEYFICAETLRRLEKFTFPIPDWSPIILLLLTQHDDNSGYMHMYSNNDY